MQEVRNDKISVKSCELTNKILPFSCLFHAPFGPIEGHFANATGWQTIGHSTHGQGDPDPGCASLVQRDQCQSPATTHLFHDTIRNLRGI